MTQICNSLSTKDNNGMNAKDCAGFVEAHNGQMLLISLKAPPEGKPTLLWMGKKMSGEVSSDYLNVATWVQANRS